MRFNKIFYKLFLFSILLSSCNQLEQLDQFEYIVSNDRSDYPSELTISNYGEFLYCPDNILDELKKEERVGDLRTLGNTFLLTCDPFYIEQFNPSCNLEYNLPDLAGRVVLTQQLKDCNEELGWATCVNHKIKYDASNYITTGNSVNIDSTEIQTSTCGLVKSGDVLRNYDEDYSSPYNNVSFRNYSWKGCDYVYGDQERIDGISALDLLLISKHIHHVKYFTELREFMAADIDWNAKIDSNDLTSLHDLLLGNITEFPITFALNSNANINKDNVSKEPFIYIDHYTYIDLDDWLSLGYMYGTSGGDPHPDFEFPLWWNNIITDCPQITGPPGGSFYDTFYLANSFRVYAIKRGDVSFSFIPN